MSENDNADDSAGSNDSINRRRFVKRLGATGIAASAGMVDASGAVSGKDVPRNTARDLEINELTGHEKQTVVRELRNTREFEQLVKKAQSRGNQVKKGVGTTRAARGSTSDRTREIVEFELKKVDADSGYLTIGRDRENDRVSVAMIEYKFVADDGTPKKSEIYEIGSGVASQQASATSLRSTSTGFSTETVEYEEKVRDARREDLSDSSTKYTAMASRTCYECRFLAVEVCNLGCGAGGGFMCGFLGLISGPVGGAPCIVFVEIVCQLASGLSCDYTGVGQAACKRVNLC